MSAQGKILYFARLMDTETRPTSLKTNTIFSWARVFTRGRKREKQPSLSERHSGKAKQITNWSVSAFKGKLKFYRYKTV